MIKLTDSGRAARTEAMRCLSRSAQAAALVILLAVAGCPQPKDPPVISSIEGRRSVEARDSADYVCRATDLYPKLLTYSWSQEGGRLGWDWGDSVRWFASDSSGRGFVRVTVTDEDGLSATDSLAITVRAETTGVLFWDGAVKAGKYQAWADTVRTGYKLYGYCGSDTGDIFLLVMDDSNFTRWAAGQAASSLLQRSPWNTKDTFSVRIDAAGLHHIIIDNTRGADDYNFWLYVWKAGP
ncbi:PKD domain-containing protein [candidate division WOR-3 bacterium]|nr:PKD domain-containing protein [candidate division WOR-3 bacterium]